MTYYSAFVPSIDDSVCDYSQRPSHKGELLNNHFKLAALRTFVERDECEPVDLVVTKCLETHKFLAKAPHALKNIEFAGTV
jgi:hypothetical protein